MAKGSYRRPPLKSAGKDVRRKPTAYEKITANTKQETLEKLGLRGKPGSGVLKPKDAPKRGSYRAAYDRAGGAPKLGDYGAWEKKAKAWNQQKYGTTEPTAKAKKMTGGSKQELAKAHSAASKPAQIREAKIPTSSPNATRVNERMSQMVASAGSPESLLDGKDRRRLERKARIQGRAEKRTRRSELKGTYGKDVGKAKFKAEYASAKQKSRAAKRTSKSKAKAESKSKSSVSSANQDLAMQKLGADIKKYSAK